MNTYKWYYVEVKAMVPESDKTATAMVRIAAVNKREAKALARLEAVKNKPGIKIRTAKITTCVP